MIDIGRGHDQTLRALCVDDDPSTLSLVSRLLERMDLEVMTADGPQRALELSIEMRASLSRNATVASSSATAVDPAVTPAACTRFPESHLLWRMIYRPSFDNSTDPGNMQAPSWLGRSNAV